MQTRLHYLKLEQKRQREREREKVQGNESWNISIPHFFRFHFTRSQKILHPSEPTNYTNFLQNLWEFFFFFPQVQNLLTSLSQLCFFNYHNVRGFFTPFILTFQPSFLWLSHFCSLIVERENKTKNKNNNNNRGCGICYC